MVTVISSLVSQQDCTHDLFLTMSWGWGVRGLGHLQGLGKRFPFSSENRNTTTYSLLLILFSVHHLVTMKGDYLSGR